MSAPRFSFLAVGAMLTALLGGCETPARNPGTAAAAPVSGPHVPDVRTEALIVQMENQYIADKNSQPTRQHEAEAEKRRKEEETRKREQAEAAQKTAAGK
jgi:hypothetical protein